MFMAWRSEQNFVEWEHGYIKFEKPGLYRENGKIGIPIYAAY
jgi:hypothetical protein